MKIIIINLDFTSGKEISYEEGLKKNTSFTTHVLDFFSFDTNADDVIVLRKDHSSISRNELLKKDQTYCNKEIRPAHNIRKMLVAGAFKFKEHK